VAGLAFMAYAGAGETYLIALSFCCMPSCGALRCAPWAPLYSATALYAILSHSITVRQTRATRCDDIWWRRRACSGILTAAHAARFLF